MTQLSSISSRTRDSFADIDSIRTVGVFGWYESAIAFVMSSTDSVAMMKRTLAAVLWFGAAWFGYEILWSVFDVPRLIGPILAAAVATLVSLDLTQHGLISRSRHGDTSQRFSAAAR